MPTSDSPPLPRYDQGWALEGVALPDVNVRTRYQPDEATQSTHGAPREREVTSRAIAGAKTMVNSEVVVPRVLGGYTGAWLLPNGN